MSDRLEILFGSAGLELQGGIANLASSAMQALIELQALDKVGRLDALLYHDRRPPPSLQTVGTVIACSSSKTRFLSGFRRLRNANRPSLALFDSVGPARVAVLPGIGRGVPHAVMVHGLELDAVARRRVVRVLDSASLVIANSATTASHVADLFPNGGPTVGVVSPCVSRHRIELWEGRVGDPLPMQDRSPTVLIAARIDFGQPGKGHETLIRCWRRVAQSIPEARLVVTGEGPGRSRLEALAVDFGIRDNVEFLGFVSDAELGRLYGEAVVFAMPSRQDGFGIAYAEAMWHGLPCIGSTADAAGDTIINDETGLLVPYGDAEATAENIIELLSNRSTARRMGEAGRRRARAYYTPDSYRERLWNVLSDANV